MIYIVFLICLNVPLVPLEATAFSEPRIEHGFSWVSFNHSTAGIAVPRRDATQYLTERKSIRVDRNCLQFVVELLSVSNLFGTDGREKMG